MRVLVLADTHLTDPEKLPANLREEISAADYILHAGDFTGTKIVESLELGRAIRGVAGNNDGPDIQAKFGFKQLFELAGLQIGIVHGDLGRGNTTLQRAMNSFEHCNLDVLIFGHSHQPYLGKHGNTWVMNPGSPTNRRRSPRYSYGLINIGAELELELVYF